MERQRAWRLLIFEVAGMILAKRLTLVIGDRVIIEAFYLVFPPDRSANEVMAWRRLKAVS